MLIKREKQDGSGGTKERCPGGIAWKAVAIGSVPALPMAISSGRIDQEAYLASLVMPGLVLFLGAGLWVVSLFRWKKGRECREWFARLG